MNKFASFIFTLIFALPVIAELKPVEGQTAFAVDLYKSISKTPENIIFSPYSIATALAMTASGADKQTLEEMKKVLRLGVSFASDYKTLLSGIQPSQDYELLVANRLWIKKDQSYFPKFILDLKNNFNADFIQLDFKGPPEPLRTQINTWVEEKTKTKIKDLIPAGVITQETDLVITNALYFKGVWQEQFLKKFTKVDDFFISKVQKKPTDFMNAQREYEYSKETDAQVLEIPYQGRELSFIIVLPSKSEEITSFENKITAKRIQTWMLPKGKQKIKLSLPKFKIELPLDLAQPLQTLGMKSAFSRANANFTQIRPLKPNENLYISAALHKSFIEVNEEGTEAAAATAVVMTRVTSVSMDLPIIFKANRPFIYFVKHIPTNSILFMGRFSQP